MSSFPKSPSHPRKDSEEIPWIACVATASARVLTRKFLSRQPLSWPNVIYHTVEGAEFLSDAQCSPWPLFQNEGRCYKPLIWKSFFSLMQINLIFTRKVVYLASFWKCGVLELESGLFLLVILWFQFKVYCWYYEWRPRRRPIFRVFVRNHSGARTYN